MMSRAVPLISLIAAIGFWTAAAVPARAEGGDSAALAAAMKNASATLQGGLKASEAQGTPISAKFEIEGAKVPLLTAAEAAVNANAGSRAVSIVPELKNGQATAEVTLLAGTAFKKVTEKLD